MKLAPARIPALLRDPSDIDVALLYGEDAGLVRERADALAHAVLGKNPDPFRLTELGDDAPKRLLEEATARSLTGGRRVVRVRAASATITEPLMRALGDRIEALIVLEAGNLDRRNKLRSWAEGAARVAPIPCYPDQGSGLAATIRDGLAQEGVSADAEVIAFLAARLGADRGITRQEIAKLAMMVGRGGALTIGDARAGLGASSTSSIDEALGAALAGDVAAADQALDAAMADGANPVMVVRGVIRALQRLEAAAMMVAGGASADHAAEAQRVFFRERPAFIRALRLWSSSRLAQALDDAATAERLCKSTGSPDTAIARQLVLTLARRAAVLVRRG